MDRTPAGRGVSFSFAWNLANDFGDLAAVLDKLEYIVAFAQFRLDRFGKLPAFVRHLNVTELVNEVVIQSGLSNAPDNSTADRHGDLCWIVST